MFEWLSTPVVSTGKNRKEVTQISGNKLTDSDRMHSIFCDLKTALFTFVFEEKHFVVVEKCVNVFWNYNDLVPITVNFFL